MFKFSGLFLIGGSFLTAMAQAATLSFQSNVVDLTFTNWSNTLELQRFDPSLGELNSVSLSLLGDVVGSAEIESRDAAAATITVNLAAQLTMTLPDSGTLVVAPSTSRTFLATAFDGARDFAGTSGITYPAESFSLSQSASFADAALFVPFIGLGSLSLPVQAIGISSASGAGNLFAGFDTRAGARATVVYDFDPASIPDPVTPVPELSTYALMLLGLGWLGIATRRRG